MKYWDRGFEEWTDCGEDTSIIPPNTKLLVHTVSNLLDVDSSTLDDSSSTYTMDDKSETDSVRSFQGPSSSDSGQPKVSSQHSWHLNYKLPTSSSNIDDKLKRGELLKEWERSAVLESIYDSVKKHTYYPKAAQYDSIVRQLSERYPKTLNPPNMAMEDAMTLWRHRLQYKFANARKREDYRIPAVQCRKRKGKTVVAPVSPKRTVPQWGVTNYLPIRPASEDDSSIHSHIEWMKKEKLKKKPHYERVAIAMNATLADRRAFIVKEGPSVKEVKERYPWLFDEEEIFLEFQRVSTFSVMDRLNEGLAKYSRQILDCSKGMKRRPQLVDDALADVNSHKEEKDRKEHMKQAAILAVPGLLGEKIEKLLVSAGGADPEDIPVFIRANDVYEVVVDGDVVTTSTELMPAFGCFLAVFYCFNLAYTATSRKTLIFFQRVVLNIQDNSPIDKSVVKILDKLNMKH